MTQNVNSRLSSVGLGTTRLSYIVSVIYPELAADPTRQSRILILYTTGH